MKKSKKRTKKNKPSLRQTYRSVCHKLTFGSRKIKPEFREQFKSEGDQLVNDFIEGGISLRQLEEKANDLIKKYPKNHHKKALSHTDGWW